MRIASHLHTIITFCSNGGYFSLFLTVQGNCDNLTIFHKSLRTRNYYWIWIISYTIKWCMQSNSNETAVSNLQQSEMSSKSNDSDSECSVSVSALKPPNFPACLFNSFGLWIQIAVNIKLGERTQTLLGIIDPNFQLTNGHLFFPAKYHTVCFQWIEDFALMRRVLRSKLLPIYWKIPSKE